MQRIEHSSKCDLNVIDCDVRKKIKLKKITSNELKFFELKLILNRKI